MFSSVMERLAERRDAKGDAASDAGFTLIELMVVLLILAILLAIAIPTFLGVTGGANDRAAQSNLNTAVTTVKAAAATNNQTYTNLSSATFASSEPSITWSTGTDVSTQGPVSVSVASTGAGVVLATWSKNNGGTCFFAVDNQTTVVPAQGQDAEYSGNVPLNAGTFYGEATGQSSCNASAALPANTDTPNPDPNHGWVTSTSNL